MDDPSIAAHRTLPFGTRIRVTNVRNGKAITAVVKDRGPYRDDGKPVKLDLSRAAAKELGFKKEGLSIVIIRILR